MLIYIMFDGSSLLSIIVGLLTLSQAEITYISYLVPSIAVDTVFMLIKRKPKK